MNNQKISLVVLAAGMGSRYGGLKQLDELGPNGETILEYSIFDAIQAGFGKVVFVIRDFFRESFEQRMQERFGNKVELAYVCQDVNPKVEGLTIPARDKPWGTSHAVMAAKQEIEEPFAVINADDYYGKDSFKIISDFLKNDVRPDLYAMIGFVLEMTLTDQGHVNRGVCKIDEEGYLAAVEEVLAIRKEAGKIIYGQAKGAHDLCGDEVVSMNFWGFHPNFFEFLEKGFRDFVRANLTKPQAEYYIPTIVDDLIRQKLVRFKVLTSQHRWYGVTYKDDAEVVRAAFRSFQDEGVYPSPLFT